MKNALYPQRILTAIICCLIIFVGCASPPRVKNKVEVPEITATPIPTPTSVVRENSPSAVFVNDTFYRLFESRQSYVPELDNLWVYLGEIQSTLPTYENPNDNFQANREIVGSKIYHSYEGCIPVTDFGNDYLGEEVIGDSIIAVIKGHRYLYLSDEANAEVEKIFDAVKRPSLLVDGVMYSLMSTWGRVEFKLDDNYTFLGTVTGAVSLYEMPTENFQANRDVVVGAKVYKLPQGEINDVAAISGDKKCYYYKALPLAQGFGQN
jgi:hypothetical protein